MSQWDRAIVLKLTSEPTCSILGHTSILSCRCSRIFWLWDRLLQSRHRQQQMAGASFAPLHTSHVLSFYLVLHLSLSLFRSPCGSLARKVKFTNPYGAPRASNERSSFSLSFLLHHFLSFPHVQILFCICTFYFPSYFLLTIFLHQFPLIFITDALYISLRVRYREHWTDERLLTCGRAK